jgi:hypothetical protein
MVGGAFGEDAAAFLVVGLAGAGAEEEDFVAARGLEAVPMRQTTGLPDFFKELMRASLWRG